MSSKSKVTIADLEKERDAVESKIEFLENEIKSHKTAPLDSVAADVYNKELDHWRTVLDDQNRQNFLLAPADIDAHKVEYFQLLKRVRVCQHEFRGIIVSNPITI